MSFSNAIHLCVFPGFSYNKTCKLVNTSQIPMLYNLRVPTDGAGESAVRIAEAFLSGDKLEGNRLPKNLMEFVVEPSKGVLEPLSEVEITVRFVFFYKKL